MTELTNQEIVLAGLDAVNAKQNVKVGEIGATQFRKQLLERLTSLPKELQDALKNGTAQISDKQYYAMSLVTGTGCKVIKTKQPKDIGLANFADGKIDNWFLCSAIRVLFAETVATEADAKAARFQDHLPAAIANGTFTLKNNTKELITDMPVEVCSNAVSGYETNKGWGEYRLNNPKMIMPLKDNEFNFDFAGNVAAGALKIILIGTEVKPF